MEAAQHNIALKEPLGELVVHSLHLLFTMIFQYSSHSS